MARPNAPVMQFGLTAANQCGYLPTEQERIAVLLEPPAAQRSAEDYERLLQAGFRRSHNDLYRPWCDHCSACQSLRVDSHNFTPSRSQRRVSNKNRDLALVIQQYPQLPASHAELFCRFINERHADGSMYPPNPDKFATWVACSWHPPEFWEWYLEDELVMVAIVDRLSESLSAMYTFFNPRLAERSLGTFAILEQLRVAQEASLHWVYLGYQIDDCHKMNYKAKFMPHQRYISQQWVPSAIEANRLQP